MKTNCATVLPLTHVHLSSWFSFHLAPLHFVHLLCTLYRSRSHVKEKLTATLDLDFNPPMELIDGSRWLIDGEWNAFVGFRRPYANSQERVIGLITLLGPSWVHPFDINILRSHSVYSRHRGYLSKRTWAIYNTIVRTYETSNLRAAPRTLNSTIHPRMSTKLFFLKSSHLGHGGST